MAVELNEQTLSTIIPIIMSLMGGGQQADMYTPGSGMSPLSFNPQTAGANYGIGGTLTAMAMNALTAKYNTPMPGYGAVANAYQINQNAQYDALQSALYSRFQPNLGNGAGIAAGALTQVLKASGGATPEMLEMASAMGISNDPAFRKFIVQSGASSLINKRHGNLAMYHSKEKAGLESSIDSMGGEAGRYASVLMAAQDFNLGSRYEKLSGGGQTAAWKKAEQDLTHAKNLLGYNPAQVFDLMSSLYEGVIGDQIPKMIEFSEKVYALQTKIPGGLGRAKALGAQLNQQARAMGIDDASFGFDYAASQLLSGSAADKFAKENDMRFNLASAAGGEQQNQIAAITSNRGKLYNQLFSLTNTTDLAGLKAKIGNAPAGSLLSKAANGTITEEELNLLSLGQGYDSGFDQFLSGYQLTSREFTDDMARGPIMYTKGIMGVMSDSPAARDAEMKARGLVGRKEADIINSAYATENLDTRREILLNGIKDGGLTTGGRQYLSELALRTPVVPDELMRSIAPYLSGEKKDLSGLKGILSQSTDQVKFDTMVSAIVGQTSKDGPEDRNSVVAILKDLEGLPGGKGRLDTLKSWMGLKGGSSLEDLAGAIMPDSEAAKVNSMLAGMSAFGGDKKAFDEANATKEDIAKQQQEAIKVFLEGFKTLVDAADAWLKVTKAPTSVINAVESAGKWFTQVLPNDGK